MNPLSPTLKKSIKIESTADKQMHGFGIYEFKMRFQRYEGEFSEDNFSGYGVYTW